MNIIKRAISLAVFVLLTSTLSVFAVSDDEIAKMKAANPEKPIARPAKARRMLMFDLSAGFQHSSIPFWAKTIDAMAEKTGAFSVDHSTDMSDFNSGNLKKYDVICFNNTTSLEPTESQQAAIMEFIKSGKGIVGIHAAADNFNNWEEGKYMMGNVFTGHPWTAGGTWAFKIDEPDHILTRSFAGKGFKLNDEIYRTDAPYYSRADRRVLISLDLSDPVTKNTEGVKPSDEDTGISWVKRVGNGRLFYCSLGHQHHVTWNEVVLEHYLAGIQYAIGDLKVDDSVPDSAARDRTAEIDGLLAKVKQYNWDKNQSALHEMTLLVRKCLNEPKNAKIIEKKLLDVLVSDANLAVKDFVCRQLAVIGTDMSVQVLGVMLVSPETSDIARYALERINSQEVDIILIEALGKIEEKFASGIIVSLGVRNSAGAVNFIKKYLSSENEMLALAAVNALAKIGNEPAAEALLSATPAVDKELVYDALLSCAQKQARNGNIQKASSLFSKVYSLSDDKTIRIGAFVGLIKTDKANSASLIKKAIEGADTLMQKTAIQTLSKVEDKALLLSIADSLMRYSDDAKVLILAALSENPNKVGEARALQLVSSDNSAVRMAAYETLAKVGTEKSVSKLALIASETRDRNEKEAVRSTLNTIPGKPADKEILNLIVSLDNAGKEMVVVELIRAAQERQSEGLSGVLFRVSKSTSRRVVSAAVRSLMAVADSGDVVNMVDLLAQNPSTSTENALNVMAGRLADKNTLIKTIVAKYNSLDNSKVKQSFLKVMGKLGSSDIADILKVEYNSSDAATKEAAFRAMTEWPGNDFIAEMLVLSKEGKDEKTRILAFRGYLRMIQAFGGKDSETRILQAFDMAERKEEKRMVIGAMANCASKEILVFLSHVLDNPDFKAEAEISAVGSANKFFSRCPELVLSIMEKILNSSSNDSVKKQAQEVIAKVKEIGAFIVDWEICGPYSEQGADFRDMHDRAFAPERNQVQWKKAVVSERGIVDISQVGSGNNQVAYVKTTIISADSQEVTLSIGSDDGVKVWINDKIVHTNNVARGLSVGSDKVKVKLTKGKNDFFVKVTQNSGGWEFCMEILKDNGKRANNIEVDTE